MLNSRDQRVLRQHLKSDQLLGVEVVPMGPFQATHTSDVESDQILSKACSLTEDDKKRVLETMDLEEVRTCTACPLCRSRTKTVFGEGNSNAQLMFVGEGPGRNEDQQGRPFVGAAGDMLNKQIAAMGLNRQEVYIANVVKCRPPNNRAPTSTETQACWGYLKRQIQAIEPSVIITLGGPATKLLLGTMQGITAIRGTWHNFEQLLPDGPVIPVMPTFHPAYLLRAYSPENRKKVWSDLQKAMTKLNGD